MNEPLPDRVVLAVIALTIVLVVGMAFLFRPSSDQDRPFLWKNTTPPPSIESPVEGSLAI